MAITPPDIVGAMRRMGWRVAPSLMNRWVNASAWTMSEAIKGGSVDPTTLPATQVDTTLVTMAWLKGYGVPSAAYTDLIANALNAAAQTQLRSRLREAGWTTGAFVHGSATLSSVQLDAHYAVNYRTFGSMTDTINDLYGAIGNGVFKAAVVGRVEVRGKGHVFVVDRVGVYFRDAYDFNDSGWVSQPLGIWNKERCLSKAESALYISSMPAQIGYRVAGFEPVNNATFDAWRTSNGRGGDFLIYSDVEWLTPAIREIPL